MKIKAYHKELKKWFWVESMENITYGEFDVTLVSKLFNSNGERCNSETIECCSKDVDLYFNIE
jgi:hypothetical protein